MSYTFTPPLDPEPSMSIPPSSTPANKSILKLSRSSTPEVTSLSTSTIHIPVYQETYSDAALCFVGSTTTPLSSLKTPLPFHHFVATSSPPSSPASTTLPSSTNVDAIWYNDLSEVSFTCTGEFLLAILKFLTFLDKEGQGEGEEEGEEEEEEQVEEQVKEQVKEQEEEPQSAEYQTGHTAIVKSLRIEVVPSDLYDNLNSVSIFTAGAKSDANTLDLLSDIEYDDAEILIQHVIELAECGKRRVEIIEGGKSVDIWEKLDLVRKKLAEHTKMLRDGDDG